MTSLATTSRTEPATAPFTETLSTEEQLGGRCPIGTCQGRLDLVHG